ncbi:aminoglycoside 6'-N-acetyltransferase [Peribacillus deserti]|uniref:Aminoglycoside 6'-N-acetyltransferase n=1 Tax=Peribacillus deserti TaxID=673318 RepID=A0ABS2QL66_9BACI|nr:GNAT family N-acetyltransferase [Peribacillus deserti]MBM7693917.1 aminoglycoside 6'-N-acetyltransferase [Peribacillus deserti]
MILFQSGKITVRTLQLKDKNMLVKWLSDLSVLKYYEGRDNPFDLNKVSQKFYGRSIEHTGCIVEYNKKEIGYIQFYPLSIDAKNQFGYQEHEIIFGMDQFIGETDYWNKGIGRLLVQSMANFLIKHKNACRIVMDPQTWNARAIKCYEKAGFKKVKLLPKNELHEGEYRDCWLIEYTA